MRLSVLRKHKHCTAEVTYVVTAIQWKGGFIPRGQCLGKGEERRRVKKQVLKSGQCSSTYRKHKRLWALSKSWCHDSHNSLLTPPVHGKRHHTFHYSSPLMQVPDPFRHARDLDFHLGTKKCSAIDWACVEKDRYAQKLRQRRLWIDRIFCTMVRVRGRVQ